jgi:hypothetical protein
LPASPGGIFHHHHPFQQVRMPQAPWSASAVEARAIASLLPYAGNARTHFAEQVAQIAASILELGFVAPVLGIHPAKAAGAEGLGWAGLTAFGRR